MNMQNNLYTIQFFSHHLTTSYVVSPRAVIVEPVGFPELMNFMDFTKLMNFA